jgi:sugar lactone lactonase YvrE
MHYKSFLIKALALLLFLGCKEKVSETSSQEMEETPPKVTLALEISAQLGEGSFWNYKTQELFWVDILGKKLYRYHPESQTNVGYDMPSYIGTVVPQTDSTAVVALTDGIYLKNMKNGTLSLLSNIEADQTGNRFNDGKADPNGNLWVGSMDLEEKNPLAKLYRVSPDGTAEAMLDSITISNGLVWDKKAETFYYIDTPTLKVRAFDYHKTTATISNERIAVKVPEALGFPDGMTIDEEDKIWVALWNGNAVVRFDPLTGEVMQRIEVPAHNVTSCAFGGPDLDILYITTASVDMTDEEQIMYPLAGSIFQVKPGVKGVPTAQFGTTK